MIRFLLRAFITTVAFYTLLPFFAGVTFHGNILQALGLGVAATALSSVLFLVLDAIEAEVSATQARRQFSLGKALLVVVPLWIVSYFLLGGLVLKLLSSFFPAVLTVSGIGSVICSGLLMFFINYGTGAYSSPSCRTCTSKPPVDETGKDESPAPQK